MRNLAVTLFGVFPACALCFFVLPLSISLVGDYVDNGGRDVLLLLVWCVLAIIGTFALFFSIEKAPGPVRMIGLACGIAAVWGIDGFSMANGDLWSFMTIGPVVTAVVLIIEGLYTHLGEGDAPDYWSQ